VDSNSPKSETLTAARTRLARSLQEHLAAIQALLDSNLADIERAGELICQTLQSGHKVLLCGNGGSAADAQHIAAELVGCYEKQRRAWPAIALTTDTSALTAISNDNGYGEVFARQVRAHANRDDLLIAISTSGRSPSVIRAAEEAKALHCWTIAMTGAAGGPLATLCDLALRIPSDRTARVQEAHITIGHLWCEMVDALSEPPAVAGG
jgi:D-sedoheptulose 7-phosphate isomerase